MAHGKGRYVSISASISIQAREAGIKDHQTAPPQLSVFTKEAQIGLHFPIKLRNLLFGYIEKKCFFLLESLPLRNAPKLTLPIFLCLLRLNLI